jgi:hypothetical protein
MRALGSSSTRSLTGQNTELILSKFFFLLVFQYLDVKNQHAGQLSQQVHRLVGQLNVVLREPRGAGGQNLIQSFLFFFQKMNFAETVVVRN